jgi:hypothetical protein
MTACKVGQTVPSLWTAAPSLSLMFPGSRALRVTRQLTCH